MEVVVSIRNIVLYTYKSMANTYTDFISDEHLYNCIAQLHSSYIKAKNKITKKFFYANKVDTFKLTFDSRFNHISEEDIIHTEVLRQVDKSINNSIGTFHEQILGGVMGYEVGKLSGFDIKAIDDTLFADLKNKHNTMNSSSMEALFQKLAKYADHYKKARCYWVQILAKSSFCELWTGEINGKEYSHSRVYEISGDQFYAMITGQQDALFQLYNALPAAIKNYMDSINQTDGNTEHAALAEIDAARISSGRTILDQITFDNYNYYSGFDRL